MLKGIQPWAHNSQLERVCITVGEGPGARLLEWVTAMINDLNATGQISDLPEKITLFCQTYYGGMLGAYADPGADPLLCSSNPRQKELRSL